ncbi:unnamed protein product [Euphydryas editha]|uniref:Reverse transcriptase domain-containing protein n=1 Tax=Euphydryas editha TaxID=104508 RepID=A0AAU9UYU8_EUPED|nr:unnamed protein product [Euphydryas editha]
MTKAFDRVWHAGLLAKLINTTTPSAIVRVIASFLEGRSFYVLVEGVDLRPRPIQAGVPQGSCLSPRLYAVYTDDIPTFRDHRRNSGDEEDNAGDRHSPDMTTLGLDNYLETENLLDTTTSRTPPHIRCDLGPSDQK